MVLAAEYRGMPRRLSMGKDGRNSVRVTTTFHRDQFEELERLADKHQVKVAWLVRYATRQLLNEAEGGRLQLDFGWGNSNA